MNREFSKEQNQQISFFNRVLEEGYNLIPNSDPYNLVEKVGQTIQLEVFCEKLTPELLCKIYIGNKEGEPFHLIPLWQIVRYLKVVPNKGEVFKGVFIVGVRKEGEKGFVPTLRLPRR